VSSFADDLRTQPDNFDLAAVHLAGGRAFRQTICKVDNPVGVARARMAPLAGHVDFRRPGCADELQFSLPNAVRPETATDWH
jgi:hypothetical protein